MSEVQMSGGPDFPDFPSRIVREIKLNILFLPILKGSVAEWLGKALQKLLQQFESARDLTLTDLTSFITCQVFHFYYEIFKLHWYCSSNYSNHWMFFTLGLLS